MTAAALDYTELEAVCASAVRYAETHGKTVEANALTKILSNIKKKALEPALKDLTHTMRVYSHGIFTWQGTKTSAKEAWSHLTSAVTLGLLATTVALGIAGQLLKRQGKSGQATVLLVTAFLAQCLNTIRANNSSVRMWKKWESEVEVSDKERKAMEKLSAKTAELKTVVTKLQAATPATASTETVLGGHRVRLVGAAAADFATEFAIREGGASIVTKSALAELHKLLGSKELTTAQKNHVAAAISELKKVN